MSTLRKINTLGKTNKSKLMKEFGFKTINQAIQYYSEEVLPKQRKYSDELKNETYQKMMNDYNDIIDIYRNEEKENKKKNKTQYKNKPKIVKAFNILYENEIIINNENIHSTKIHRWLTSVELKKMNKTVKENALFQQKIQYFNANGNSINGKVYLDGSEIDLSNLNFETTSITKEFMQKVIMQMSETYDSTWNPELVANMNGFTRIYTCALKPIQNKKTKQTYKENSNGTCVYDGVLSYFASIMEKNKNAKSIYNKLIANKETYAKPYTDEEIENELAPFCKASITIKNLINGKDKKFNENKFNRFNIEFMNTKYNHLDLLTHNYHEIELVSKQEMAQIKHDSPFYISKFGNVITLDKTYKQIDTNFQIAYKEWKSGFKTYDNVEYDKMFIYQDSDEYKMLDRYDYKLHTFFNDFEIDNSLYLEADLKKAYFNYSDDNYNRFYRGLPSGSFLNFTCNEKFDFNKITQNGLIGFYEIKIIDSKLDKRLGLTNNSIHYLFTSMIELLLENDVKIKFLNASYSPSVDIPFSDEMKEIENINIPDEKLKHYCKAFGLMLAENSTTDIIVKPLQCDEDYFDTIDDENVFMFQDENLIKLQYKNKKIKSYIHMAYTIHAYTQTLVLEQLIKMNMDYVFGVKLDSIVYKKDYQFDFGNNFDEKECKIEKMLDKSFMNSFDTTKYDMEREKSAYFRKYIVSADTTNLKFRKPFTQSGEYITSRVVFIGGPGGSGKTYSLLKYLHSNTACYTTLCWNLIQGKIEEYNGIGHSIPQLTGGSQNFKCQKTGDRNIRHIIIDEATLVNKIDILHIVDEYPSCFIYILGDVDYDGMYYQASVTKQVFNPSEDNHIKIVNKDDDGFEHIKMFDFDLQYIKYTETFRFDDNLKKKLNVLRNVMRNNHDNDVNKNIRIHNIMNCVRKEFGSNFKDIDDVVFNDNDVGITAKDDVKNGNTFTNHFIEKGSKPKYFIKNTIKEKNQLKGQELLEKPDHNNYECKLFKTIHSFQGLDLNHNNKIVIIIDSLFDENLLYTALSRARRQDQIVIIDKTL